MVIGCKICEEPLVNFEAAENCRIMRKYKEEVRLKAEKFGITETELNAVNKNQIFESEWVIRATKCGHLFHKQCLKKHIASFPNGLGECPICSKPIHYAHTWPIVVHLGPNENVLEEKEIDLRNQNEMLKKQMCDLRKKLEDKDISLENIYRQMAHSRHELMKKKSEYDKRDSKEFREEVERMEKERKTLKQVIMNINRQNTKILSMISELAESRGGDVSKVTKRRMNYEKYELVHSVHTNRIRSAKPGVGVFFNKNPIRTEYAFQNGAIKDAFIYGDMSKRKL